MNEEKDALRAGLVPIKTPAPPDTTTCRCSGMPQQADVPRQQYQRE